MEWTSEMLISLYMPVELAVSYLFSKQPSQGRLQTAISCYIEQPPHSHLQTGAWRGEKYLSHT